MKKRYCTLLTGTLILSLAWMALPVLAEEGTGQDILSLYFEHTSENVLIDYGDDDYILPQRGLQCKTYSGVLALDEEDLDWDGQNELLVIKIKEKEENPTQNMLMADIYELNGNRIEKKSSALLAEEFLFANTSFAEVFWADTEQGRYLCCESMDHADIFADGVSWNVKMYSFDGNSFVSRGDTGLCGSYWEPEDEAQARTALEVIGLYDADVVNTPITQQIDHAEVLNQIRRNQYADYEQIRAYLDMPDGDGLVYGETVFTSFINQDLYNKLPGDPVTVHDQGVSAETGDYILPQSSSTYLTAEELDQLTPYEIYLARNEIYARHGRMFVNQDLQDYFGARSWYQPTVPGESFTESYAAGVFNEYERANLDLIVEYERAHNINQ